jgi:hypothetical protein
MMVRIIPLLGGDLGVGKSVICDIHWDFMTKGPTPNPSQEGTF